MADPFKDLARTLENRSKNNANNAALGVGAELGTITERNELKLDNFKYALKEFLISEHLRSKNTWSTGYSEQHLHFLEVPDEFKAIRQGDRVLAIPVNNGQDFVVIAKVMSNA